MIDKLLADNSDVKECVRQFDSDICGKAGKLEMKILREDLLREFVHIDKWVQVTREFDDMDERFEAENQQLLSHFALFRVEQL